MPPPPPRTHTYIHTILVSQQQEKRAPCRHPPLNRAEGCGEVTSRLFSRGSKPASDRGVERSPAPPLSCVRSDAAADHAQMLARVPLVEAVRQLRTPPHGEALQARRRVDERADAVVRDGAAPAEVERLEAVGAVLLERDEARVAEGGHVVERQVREHAAACRGEPLDGAVRELDALAQREAREGAAPRRGDAAERVVGEVLDAVEGKLSQPWARLGGGGDGVGREDGAAAQVERLEAVRRPADGRKHRGGDEQTRAAEGEGLQLREPADRRRRLAGQVNEVLQREPLERIALAGDGGHKGGGELLVSRDLERAQRRAARAADGGDAAVGEAVRARESERLEGAHARDQLRGGRGDALSAKAEREQREARVWAGERLERLVQRLLVDLVAVGRNELRERKPGRREEPQLRLPEEAAAAELRRERVLHCGRQRAKVLDAVDVGAHELRGERLQRRHRLRRAAAAARGGRLVLALGGPLDEGGRRLAAELLLPLGECGRSLVKQCARRRPRPAPALALLLGRLRLPADPEALQPRVARPARRRLRRRSRGRRGRRRLWRRLRPLLGVRVGLERVERLLPRVLRVRVLLAPLFAHATLLVVAFATALSAAPGRRLALRLASALRRASAAPPLLF
mmetsp:Transcript_6707/g.22153  ORF Transcript_6707/g.22153 Transcript_6707/m.22153 type:complete len:631 (+) Transcript_6707:58-1950(+)